MSNYRKRNKWESLQLNNETYVDYYQRLKEIALNVFEWRDVPDTIDPRYLELCLYEQGYALYFNDPVIGDLALKCTIGGELDVYNVPKFRQAIANNGYTKNCTQKDSVIIFNNYLRTPTDLTIRLFARRLYEIERTIDVNVKSQKTPVLVLASEQQRLSMKNLYMQYDGNEPFIFGDKNLTFEDIKAINTQAPYVSEKLEILKHQIWNEALTFLGVENSNADKKERLVSDEVGGNYGDVEIQRNIMLNARQYAVEKINQMFGTDIKILFRSNLITAVNITNVDEEVLAYQTMQGEQAPELKKSEKPSKPKGV